jgi:hypothetical protein
MSERSRISRPVDYQNERHEIARHLENWQDEIESAYLDRALIVSRTQAGMDGNTLAQIEVDTAPQEVTRSALPCLTKFICCH